MTIQIGISPIAWQNDDLPDLTAAQSVADHIGTEHYGFTFTVEEGINAISDVIYHLGTDDVTTIRAGTPMFLLARKIKAMGVKMVMSGEGADETKEGADAAPPSSAELRLRATSTLLQQGGSVLAAPRRDDEARAVAQPPYDVHDVVLHDAVHDDLDERPAYSRGRDRARPRTPPASMGASVINEKPG